MLLSNWTTKLCSHYLTIYLWPELYYIAIYEPVTVYICGGNLQVTCLNASWSHIFLVILQVYTPLKGFTLLIEHEVRKFCRKQKRFPQTAQKARKKPDFFKKPGPNFPGQMMMKKARYAKPGSKKAIWQHWRVRSANQGCHISRRLFLLLPSTIQSNPDKCASG